jgi:multiple sugar transport system permease protein/fructooligosaccharide transport system permease protein
MAALVFTTLPMIIIFLLFQKYYVQGVTSSGVKG